jgi:predicted nucleic acid-binding protein
MKRYWDTSALVEAMHDSKIEAKALESDQWTRPHTLSEAFSTLTGGRLGFKYAPDDAAALLKEITGGMNFIELDKRQTLAALALAQKRGIRGGRVHDWMHARAAAHAGVAVLVTDNHADFVGLEDGFRVSSPSDVLSE